MDPFIGLFLLSISMFIGSYFFGTLPMFFNFSESNVKMLTIFGAGILAGTALSVIIPEGVNSIYSSLIEQMELECLHKNSTLETLKLSHHHLQSPHSVIGLTLVLGFVFMLLIDQISTRHSNSYSPLPVDSENGKAVPSTSRRQSSKITATIGLIVHAAADGVALGAAAATAHQDVEIVIFLAIMLHKAPASFGLVTFLLHEGLDKQKIKKHLLSFALSAPIGTILTYWILMNTSTERLNEFNATGIAMIFSGGTFLYVATVHVLPEITHGNKLKLFELFCVISGCFLPSMLTFNHHH